MTKNAKLSQKWPIYMRNISCDRASAFGVRNPVRTVRKRSGEMAVLPNSGPNERSVRGRSAFERIRRTERPHLYNQWISIIQEPPSKSNISRDTSFSKPFLLFGQYQL